MSHSTRLGLIILLAWLASLVVFLYPSFSWADAFFCDHRKQTGKGGATPEVVITSEGESIQQGVEMSVRCIHGLTITLFIKDAEETSELPVLRFAGKDSAISFPLRPSHLGRSFLIPDQYEQQLVNLLRQNDSLALEVVPGTKKNYHFVLSRAHLFLAKLPCLK